MMNNRKLRARQAAMLAKRGRRPWDGVKEDQCRASQLRLRQLFRMGLSDSRIAEALDLNVQAVWLLRSMNCRRSRSKPVSA